jgi:cyclase
VLLCRGRQLVKGQRFDSWRSVGVAMQAARIHAMRGVDELCILDIGATPEGRGPDFDLVRELSENCFIPLTVGGGVRTVDDVDRLLRAGADKVCMETAAFIGASPWLITNCSQRFGNQAIVVSITHRGGNHSIRCGQINTPTPAVQAANSAAFLGAGEIMLNSIDRDGTMTGYDIDMIRAVSAAVDVPVIACGGCSGYADMLAAVRAGASGVAAGALFQFTDCTPAGAAEYLAQHGVETRRTACA